jgi:hypothetical protein
MPLQRYEYDFKNQLLTKTMFEVFFLETIFFLQQSPFLGSLHTISVLLDLRLFDFLNKPSFPKLELDIKLNNTITKMCFFIRNQF